MPSSPLSAVRRSVIPQAGDTWAAIAKRELPDVAEADAVSNLQSWNMHVFMRPAPPPTSARAGNPILPSDVIFVEPPRAQA